MLLPPLLPLLKSVYVLPLSVIEPAIETVVKDALGAVMALLNVEMSAKFVRARPLRVREPAMDTLEADTLEGVITSALEPVPIHNL